MLRPAMSQILREGESAYAFVVGVARRAREIADEDIEQGVFQDAKPVTLALQEYAAGKVKLRDEVTLKGVDE